MTTVRPIIETLALLASGGLLLPVAVFAVQCLAGLLPPRRSALPGRRAAQDAMRPRATVLLPAHNEEATIATALRSLLPQLREGDRLVVVADNCTDATASIARRLGAEVIERTNASQRGKGYALDFGVRHISRRPTDVLVVLDADCVATPGMLGALLGQVRATAAPAQAVYRMEPPPGAKATARVSALAFLVKNQARPAGLDRLGLPCLLTGTGMAFPWNVIKEAQLASGNLVEDMQLSCDLALARHAPRLCHAARVTGQLPAGAAGAATQRRRWEHGHLLTMIHNVPRLLASGLRYGNLAAIVFALDLCVPPLSLLILTLLTATAACTAVASAGYCSWLPSALLMGGTGAVAVCVLAAWWRWGRDLVPLKALLACPFYAVWKFPIYFGFLLRRQTRWIRTQRSAEDERGSGCEDDNELTNGGAGVTPLPTAPVPASIQLSGVKVHVVTEQQCVEHVLRQLERGRGGVVVTPNLDHLRRSARDAEYAEMLNNADLVVADGMPLVWASRIQGQPLPERVAGSNLITSLTGAAAERGRSIFLLGGNPGAAEGAADALRGLFPKLRVAGYYCPPMGFENDPEQMDLICDQITGSRPDIVYVALGSPKQERLIGELKPVWPKAWWMGVGISFSFVAGHTRRAPLWMQRAGLEWCHRMLQEPQRLAKRYLVDDLPFAASLFGSAAAHRVTTKVSSLGLRWSALPAAVGAGAMGLDAQVPPSAVSRLAPRSSPAFAPTATTTTTTTTTTTPAAAAVNAPGPATGAGPGISRIVYQSFLTGLASELVSERQLLSRRTALARPFDRRSLAGLRAIVLLGGSVRTNDFATAVRRSIVDLPLEVVEGASRTILHLWYDHARELERSYDVGPLPLRVMVDHRSPIPLSLRPRQFQHVQTERDQSRYRGTGGVLRDLAQGYADDDLILVATAAQVMIEPVPDLLAQLAETWADVAFVSHGDGTPSGLMLIRCAALRSIAPTGYVDLKEQALPALAKRFRVRPVSHSYSTALPVRQFDEYLAALQWHHRGRGGGAHDPFGEGRDGFSVVESGAEVDPRARVHDSVVLRGGRLERDAVAVRSVVCPGAVLRRERTAVDRLVPAATYQG